MLAKLSFTLKNVSDKEINTNMSSAFQGILMQALDSETATWLHEQKRHPYSQSIIYEKNIVYWTISTLSKEAYEHIIQPLLENERESFWCEYHKIEFKIIDKELQVEKMEEALEKHYFQEVGRIFTIEFLTPTSFKSGGAYMNYPSVRWIFQSLMNKYDACEGADQIYDEEMLRFIEEQVSISQYKLKSTLFHLEGVKIPAFKGYIKLHARCPQSALKLINFLLKFGEYSGVGIKCAMGMGAIEIQNSERKDI